MAAAPAARLARLIETESLHPEGRGAPPFEGRAHGGVQPSFFVTGAAPDGGVSLHRHPYDEVFVIVGGEARFSIGSEPIEAHGGQVLVAPAGVAHSLVNSGTGTLHTVNIHPAERVIMEWL